MPDTSTTRRRWFQFRLSTWFMLVATAIMLILPLALIMFGPAIEEYLGRKTFDPVAWQANRNASGSDQIRIKMVDDLTSRYRFVGMSRQQVISILGEGDDTDYFNDWDMVFCLGPQRSFIAIDSEWLVIRFNERQIVSEYAIVAD